MSVDPCDSGKKRVSYRPLHESEDVVKDIREFTQPRIRVGEDAAYGVTAMGSVRTPRSASSPVAAAAITANPQALRKICVGGIPRVSR
jgi:hypothetical protein